MSRFWIPVDFLEPIDRLDWMKFRAIANACCTPIYAEMLKPRAVALGLAALAAAQVGCSMAFGIGLPCMFHLTTGMPCPGCGLTRSVMSLLRGNVQESLLFHPFGPPLFAALVVAIIVALLPTKPRTRIIRKIASIESKTALVMIMFVLFMILWGLRIANVVPLTNLGRA